MYMNFYKAAPAWTNEVAQKQCPHTSPKAKPKQFKEIINGTVISVKNAQYRDATFSGTFLLADGVSFNMSKPPKNLEVYCLWYGYRLRTRGIKLIIDPANTELCANYDGEIVSNLAS